MSKSLDEFEEDYRKLDVINAQRLVLKLEVSDLLFNQYTNHQNKLNMCLCSIQLIILVLNVVLDLGFDLRVGNICCVCEILLAIVISANILIGSHTWEKSKLKEKDIDRLIDEFYIGDDEDAK